jgi:branched-chain amino acid transport system substrate-binding protein
MSAFPFARAAAPHRTRLLLLAGLAVLGGCADASTPVVIGAAGPWEEAYGLANRRGVELAVQHINAAGGVRGRPIEAVFRDDEGDGATAARIAADFVADARIAAVVGHVNSGAMVAAAKVYDGALPAVATTATAPELTGISRWTFRVITSDSATGVALARFAGGLGRRRAAILYENDAYGRGLADAFRRAFTGEVVSIDPIEAGAADFEPYVTYYQTRHPDVVFVAGTEVSGLALLREARRQGLPVDFLGGDGWTGITGDTAASEGVYVAAPFTAADPRLEVQRFVEAFRTRFGVEPDGNAALAYDATRLIAQAIDVVGVDREAIREQLATLAARNGYPGVTGTIRFDGNGDLVGRGALMTRVERGNLVPSRVE